MAKLRKNKLPCVRRLRSTTNARMTRALPNTVASTSSPMSAASSAAVAAAKGPPRCPSAAQALAVARGLPEWLSHGKSWPMAPGGEPAALRRCPALALAPLCCWHRPCPATAPAGRREGAGCGAADGRLGAARSPPGSDPLLGRRRCGKTFRSPTAALSGLRAGETRSRCPQAGSFTNPFCEAP